MVENDYLKRAMDEAKAARNFPRNTCPASRHVHLIAEALASGEGAAMLTEDPKHVAASLYSVLASLWTARTQLDDDGNAK